MLYIEEVKKSQNLEAKSIATDVPRVRKPVTGARSKHVYLVGPTGRATLSGMTILGPSEMDHHLVGGPGPPRPEK